MQLKSDFRRSCLLLTAILFVLFLSLTNVKAQTNSGHCPQPAALSQSEKADIIKNVRQIIGGYNPSEKTFNDAKISWYEYFRCVEAPALQKANEIELSGLYAKISQSALSATLQSLDLNAENAEAKSVAAEIMMLNSNRSAAVELVQQAIALDPENFEAHFLSGVLNSDLASIERSIALNPGFASAYNLKAELLLTQASKLEDEAQRAKYQTGLETIKTMLALPSPPEAEFWREQQSSLTIMVKPDSPSNQQATAQTTQTQPVLPVTAPVTAKPSDGVGTGRVQGTGSGNGVGSGSGNGIGNGTASNQRAEQNSVVNATDNSNRKLNLQSKPRANYTELARITQTTGTVRVRVTFSADGQIKNVLAISFLPFGLTQQAVKAAKQIKFVPEIRSKTPVSVSKMVEYNFMLY